MALTEEDRKYKRDYARKWRAKNKERSNEISLESYHRHKEKNKELFRLKSEANRRKDPGKARAACRASYRKKVDYYNAKSMLWQSNNREKVRASHRKTKQIQRDVLSDQYVKQVLIKNSTLTYKHIPQSLVEVKRAQLKVKRFIKEQ